MARPKKSKDKGYLLLDRKKKTYVEIGDRETLVNKVTGILLGGTDPSQFGIARNEMITFNLELKISLNEGEPKTKRGRKPKKARKARKYTGAKRGRKPKAKAGLEAVEPAVEVEEAPTKKPRKKRTIKRAVKQVAQVVEEKRDKENK